MQASALKVNPGSLQRQNLSESSTGQEEQPDSLDRYQGETPVRFRLPERGAESGQLIEGEMTISQGLRVAVYIPAWIRTPWPQSPPLRLVHHAAKGRERPVGLDRGLAHRPVEAGHLFIGDVQHLAVPETRENVPLDEPPRFLRGARLMVDLHVVLQVALRQLAQIRRGTVALPNGGWISPGLDLREASLGEVTGLLRSELPMAAELEAPLTAWRAVADDVGLDAARLDPDAEARELVVPVLELFGARDEAIHKALGDAGHELTVLSASRGRAGGAFGGAFGRILALPGAEGKSQITANIDVSALKRLRAS